jgi:hypothetical protein
MYLITKDSEVKASVEKVFDELVNVNSRQEAFDSGITLNDVFIKWVEENKISDPKFNLK